MRQTDYFCSVKTHSSQRLQGIFYAALSSATFGLAPFFTLLLLGAGYSPFEVLAYRWGVAALFLGLCARAGGRSLRLQSAQAGAVLLLSVLRAATSLCLVVAYANIASGVASTIHFMYPLAVALAMMCFFREKRSGRVLGAVAVSIGGAVLLSAGNVDFSQGDTLLGIGAACTSVLTYGAYIIGVRKSGAASMDSTVLTGWVTALGALFFVAGGMLTGGVRLETDGLAWGCILGLALPATAVSNMTLVLAIQRIGPTLTSVFGALEPLTAVIVGATFFREPFTLQGAAGIVLIVLAVGIVVFRRRES